MFESFSRYDNETLTITFLNQKQMKLLITIDYANKNTFLNNNHDVFLKRN